MVGFQFITYIYLSIGVLILLYIYITNPNIILDFFDGEVTSIGVIGVLAFTIGMVVLWPLAISYLLKQVQEYIKEKRDRQNKDGLRKLREDYMHKRK